MTATASVSTHPFRGSLWIYSWIAFVGFHAALTALDWQLRDHHASTQPMPGGIPDRLHSFIAYGSIAVFGVALYCALPGKWAVWKKSILTLLQIAIAFSLLLWAMLYYVVSNGIDTL